MSKFVKMKSKLVNFSISSCIHSQPLQTKTLHMFFRNSFRDSDHKSIRGNQIFKEPHEIPSSLNRGALPEPFAALKSPLLCSS